MARGDARHTELGLEFGSFWLGGVVRAVEFGEFELDAAAPVEGVLESSEFAGEGFQAIEAFGGVFDGSK